MRNYRIVILFHERANRESVKQYLIMHFARYWVRSGHEVIVLFGTRKKVLADVLVMHVDLSVVPDSYLRFAESYPVVINGRVRDIRKSTISRNLVKPGDAYKGPVIAKSDLNFAGVPERTVNDSMMRAEKAIFEHSSQYRIFESYPEVPGWLLESPEVVIEKFLPEMEGELYCTRFYQFFGAKETFIRMLSSSPVVNSDSAVRYETIEPDPGIVSERRRLGLDYGKLDYVEINGQVQLLDANKTVGYIPISDNPDLERIREYRAQGLFDFLPG